MAQKETFHGVPGMLRPFKECIKKNGLKKGDQIVYYGFPGTCTPFVELLAYAVRSLELEQVFVPFVDEHRAKKIGHVDDVGMQAHITQVTCNPKAIVIMGGLSLPHVPVTVEQVKEILARHPGTLVIGVSSMHMFQEAGWLDTISFDCLIDAMIDPVEVTMKS